MCCTARWTTHRCCSRRRAFCGSPARWWCLLLLALLGRSGCRRGPRCGRRQPSIGLSPVCAHGGRRPSALHPPRLGDNAGAQMEWPWGTIGHRIWQDTNRQPARCDRQTGKSGHSTLTSMPLGLVSAVLGICRVSTPSLKVALAALALTLSGSEKLRLKLP